MPPPHQSPPPPYRRHSGLFAIISCAQVGKFCSKMGLTFSDDDLAVAIAEMETDGSVDGKVDMNEFHR